MNSRDIVALKKDILFHLSKRQLKDAFDGLVKLGANTHDWRITESLNQLETNYKLMLHYLFEGVEDPERRQLFYNLLRSMYELTDDATDELLKVESATVFYEKQRMNDFKNTTINEYHSQLRDINESFSLIELQEEGEEKNNRKKDIAVKAERIESDMFNAVFASPRLTEKEAQDYHSMLNGYELSTRNKCIFVSALTLNLFHRFDARKVSILMNTAISDNPELRARAVVGLVIVLQMYNIRWPLYKELQHQLDSISENVRFRKDISRVIIQLIRSHDTEMISKKVTEEILPEMMKFNNLAGRKLKMDELMGETELSDKNPEWQKELEESGLGRKLQEYSNLQMEGADVFHSTFSGLKHFPFFMEMSNWFLPFDTSYSTLQPLFSDSKKNSLLQSAISDSGHMCNSDKYSFSLSLLQISATQREIMMNQLGTESEEVKKLQKDAQALNPTIDDEIISNQYIQDLYRFFKLNPYKSSFFDIFKLSLNFYDKVSIAPLISDIESMRRISLFCFDKNHFKEALDIFERLVNVDTENDDIWQKIGYCRQMLGDMNGALTAYLQADLIKPNNSWIIRRIAQLYRTTKKTELSLEYYKKAAQLSVDNLNIEMNIGHCYLEMKDYEKALNSYFKVELLDTKSKKTLRPIAWTAFLLRKYELSQKYYKQILNDNPTVHDYLNAGHVELCMNNKKSAFEFYKQGAEMEENLETFINLFEADREILNELGINIELLPYIFDQIKYLSDGIILK